MNITDFFCIKFHIHFQGEPSFAMEILGAVRAQNLITVQNIRV